jgi:hypothetical protein
MVILLLSLLITLCLDPLRRSSYTLTVVN